MCVLSAVTSISDSFQQLRNTLAVCLDSDVRTVLIETHAIGQQAHRLQKIMNNHRTIDVEPKLPGCPHIDGHIVTHHPQHSIVTAFTLGRTTLPHTGTARLFLLRDSNLANAAAGKRAGRQPANIVGDFISEAASPLMRHAPVPTRHRSLPALRIYSGRDKRRRGNRRQFPRPRRAYSPDGY